MIRLGKILAVGAIAIAAPVAVATTSAKPADAAVYVSPYATYPTPYYGGYAYDPYNGYYDQGYYAAPGYAYAPGYYYGPSVGIGVGFGGWYGHGWHRGGWHGNGWHGGGGHGGHWDHHR